MSDIRDRILVEVDELRDEMVSFLADLIRIPTVNPPGEAYEECAHFLGDRLAGQGFEVEYFASEGRPEHTAEYPRVNVVGARRGSGDGPTVHVNGHFDVVPAGEGWVTDPFGGEIRDGRIYGRGSCDMKGGLAAGIFAFEALRRAGARLTGTVEVSGTVDEESGGFAGVAWLAEHGRFAKDRIDHVIIPEPLNVDRICIGHRGVYWFEITTKGRIAHGCMPFLGLSAIDHMAAILEAVRTELQPALASRITEMPVVPEGARRSTLNVNAVVGGQPADGVQSPCVADRCRAIFDRRFLIEEGFEGAKSEVLALLARVAERVPDLDFEIEDLMIVHPVRTPEGSPLVASLQRSISEILGVEPELIASPGTYDQKHFGRIAGVEDCVAYGPGILELAHQPDEYCVIEDLVNSAKVMALTTLDLAGAD
jgi:succinyl-diaminopimelate desuccinylase